MGKTACRAIQMADLLAFYVRRHGVAQEKALPEKRIEIRPDPMLEIITSHVPVRAFVATDFGEAARLTKTQFMTFQPGSRPTIRV